MTEQELLVLKDRVGYNGKPQQFKYGFDLAIREVQAAQQKEGFIAISRLFDNDVVVAVERKVESQLVASGIDADPFRLDGDRIIEVLIAAVQEST